MSDQKQTGENDFVDSSCRSQTEQSNSSDESDSTGPLYERVNPILAWVIVIIAFLICGSIGSIIAQTTNVIFYMIFGYLGAIPFYAFLTKSGFKWRDNVNSHLDSSNQTQTTDTTRREQICSSCGWQNSRENNFCHDCGTELVD